MTCNMTSPRDALQVGMEALVCAAMLNNGGAHCLANGDFQNAYQSFKNALDMASQAELALLLQNPIATPIVGGQAHPQYTQQHCSTHRHGIQSSKQLQNYVTSTQETEGVLKESPLGQCAPPHATTPSPSASRAPSPFKNSTFFLYNEPFVFYSPDAAQGFTAERVALHKSQILFNLALVHHLAGGCVDDNSVFNALKLYDLCLENTIALAATQEGLAITIVALNNKAHIFHEFCEFRSLQVVQETIYAALVFLPKGVQVMDNSMLQGILFNVYMLRNLNCARAA
ncbi:expressed unknown protein [Seminavis robusta]|uniref:Uncharacterized protein n=1 Tax=Seminavis robusta TaxID=568900 RepID=A0A9N8HS56_9STRA|nr:expressed unknown protein [Seminavis robusta]|eukprot:Sro1671_g290080.1 n/a (285) ;mRNA; f:17682-18536